MTREIPWGVLDPWSPKNENDSPNSSNQPPAAESERSVLSNLYDPDPARRPMPFRTRPLDEQLQSTQWPEYSQLPSQRQRSQQAVPMDLPATASSNQGTATRADLPMPNTDEVNHALDFNRSGATVPGSGNTNGLYSLEGNRDEAVSPIKPRRIMMGAEIKKLRDSELIKMHRIQFNMMEGDTLVFVDYPNSNKADCLSFAYSSQKFRVHSQKLLATGSPKFKEMLESPTYQHRVQRRRKMVKQLPEGVKYIIDLTPPSEGDDLVFQMTELSLTPGIMKWWSSTLLHDVDPWLVGGHDDVCSCGNEIPTYRKRDSEGRILPMNDSEPESQAESTPEERFQLPPKPETLLQMKARGESILYTTPEYRNIRDYCPIRHCNAIVRLLMIIEGQDVVLDSAPRLWTMVAIGKIFECPAVMQNKVAQWIMCGLNTRFIEVLPEEALQLGTTLELPHVTQCAFRILVNELALKETASEELLRRCPPRTTIFGRKQEDLADELSNTVQHSARALIERMNNLIVDYHNPDLFEDWKIYDWERLRSLERLLQREDPETTKDARQHLSHLMKAVSNTFTNKFDHAFDNQHIRNEPSFANMDQDRATYVEPKNFDSLNNIMALVTPIQKMLLPFIYNELSGIFTSYMFTGVTSSVIKSTKLQTFESLLEHVQDAIQELIYQKPQLARSEGWNEFMSHPREIHVSYRASLGLKTPLIELRCLGADVVKKTGTFTHSWVRHQIEPPLNITRHMLLTITNNEMKYLPLWAGGNDDGSGGVFEAFLPPAEWGPNGPGPAYHTGHTMPSASSLSGSLMEEIRGMKVMGSTTAGSVDVNDSISTVYRPDQVIVEDRSIASEEFAVSDTDFRDAQFAVPAENQVMGQAIDMMMDTSDSDSEATMTDFDDSVTDL